MQIYLNNHKGMRNYHRREIYHLEFIGPTSRRLICLQLELNNLAFILTQGYTLRLSRSSKQTAMASIVALCFKLQTVDLVQIACSHRLRYNQCQVLIDQNLGNEYLFSRQPLGLIVAVHALLDIHHLVGLYPRYPLLSPHLHLLPLTLAQLFIVNHLALSD